MTKEEEALEHLANRKSLDYTNIEKFRDIGGAGNYYGGIVIMESKGDFYIGVCGQGICQAQSIPESLYQALMEFQDALDRKEPGVGELVHWEG